MAERWISFQEVLELTGKSRAWVFQKVNEGKIIDRASETTAANGRVVREYALSSLSIQEQVLHSNRCLDGKTVTVTKTEVIEREPKAPLAIREPQQIARPRAIVPEHLKADVQQRINIIKPLLEFRERAKTEREKLTIEVRGGKSIHNFVDLAKHVAEETGVSLATILRWEKRYRENGETDLTHRIRSDRNISRAFRNFPEAEGFVKSVWLGAKTKEFTVQLTYEAMLKKWPTFGYADAPPSYNTVRSLINSIPLTVETLARHGERAFMTKCAPHIIRTKQPAMRHWIMDHRPHDTFIYNTIFDELPPLKEFRPAFTLVLDWGSWRVMGCTWAPIPSSRTIGSAVRRAVREVGFPENFYTDNGEDFKKWGRDLRAPEVTQLLETRGVGITKARPYNSQAKPIEGWFSGFSKRLDPQFGSAYCGRKAGDASEFFKDAQSQHKHFLAGKSRTTLFPSDKEFIIEAMEYLYEYNDRPQKGLGNKSPNEVFNEQCPPDSRQSVDRRILDRLFWQRDGRTLDRGGCIGLNRVTYAPKPEYLLTLSRRQGQRVTIARDPYDLREAVAFDPQTGEFLGEFEVQFQVDQTPNGKFSIDGIKAGDRAKREVRRATRAMVEVMHGIAQQNGWTTENVALLERAKLRTGTDDARISAVAPGANSTPAVREQRKLPTLAPAFVGDGIDDDFGDVELQK